MTTPWQIQFLGGLRISREGSPTVSRLRTAKTTALLAFLCLNPGRDHGREELVERFWPDLPFEAGRNSLRVALSALRRTLDGDEVSLPSSAVLSATRSHVRLRVGAVETDVILLEAALRRGDRALAATIAARGAFLPGVMDEWVYEEQARVEALREEALEEAEGVTPTPTSAVSPPPAPRDNVAPRDSAPETDSRRVAGSVPIPLGQFFGREAEIAQILTLLAAPGTRLVTVSGTGGTGKTRLAVEVARALREGKAIFPPDRVRGGVWFVPLISATAGAHILPAICRAVGANLSGSDDALETLADHFGRFAGKAILVLDNLEQIEPEGCAEMLLCLLERIPTVVCLATSRRRVGLPGECVFPLSPFPLPRDDDSLVSLATHPAVALFVDRAREADIDFVLTPRRAPQIVDLCVRLDGVPLALEMAASWAGVYTPAEMAHLATSGADELIGRHAGRDSRHRSLRAVADWSIRLLPPDARDLLAALSVFQGRWTKEAAATIAPTAYSPNRLALLCDHSLITTATQEKIDATDDSEGNEPPDRFFQIMPSLRPFAQELLREEGDEGARARSAHARYFADAAREMRTTPETLPDTLAALAFQESDPETIDDALELVAALWSYWWKYGSWDEAQAIASRVLDRAVAAADSGVTVSPKSLYEALRCAAKLAFYRHDFEVSRDFMHQRLVIARKLDNAVDVLYLKANFATLDLAMKKYQPACDAFEAILPALSCLGPDTEGSSSYIFHNYAETLFRLGRIDDAQTTVESHLQSYKRQEGLNQGLESLDWSLLAEIHRARGRLDEARTCVEISLAIFREHGETFRIADVLLLIAGIARESDDRPRAFSALRESFALRRRVPSSDGFRRSVDEARHFFVDALALTEESMEAIYSPNDLPRDAFAKIDAFLERQDAIL